MMPTGANNHHHNNDNTGDALHDGAETQGAALTNIEPAADVNDVLLLRDSGMLMATAEQTKMPIYFIPALGPAPRWCSFLESLTVRRC